MLEYDRIDISEGIVIDKTNKSKEWNICHYWSFLDKNFNYDPCLCNGCHDLMRKAVSFKHVAIVSIKANDYRIHFCYISKNDAITIMTNSNSSDKNGVLYIFFITCIKYEWNNLLSKKQRSDFKQSKGVL